MGGTCGSHLLSGDMKLIGITGGIGMGKSASAALLSKRGFPVMDTDIIAHQIVEPGQPSLPEIQETFGPGVIAPDGTLRRGELAKIVFSNPAALRHLENILHPRIRAVWQAEAERWKEQGARVGFVVIPLLFETNAASSFSATICVACSDKSQHERLLERGWSAEAIQQRISAQFPTSKKMDMSDYVIWTETTMDIHAAQLDHLLSNNLA
jgi:dephospho-CoA kinase